MTIKGGPQGAMKMTMADGKMHMEAAKMTMAGLAEAATNFVGRPVVDMTDLKGNYQVVLDISMNDIQGVARSMGMAAPGAEGAKTGEASDPSGSSIFMSIQQMGLKLESRKLPLGSIVIDHVEKTPTEN